MWHVRGNVKYIQHVCHRRKDRETWGQTREGLKDLAKGVRFSVLCPAEKGHGLTCTDRKVALGPWAAKGLLWNR